MGCCASNVKLEKSGKRAIDLNASLNSVYLAATPSPRSGSKRSYSSRRSSGNSTCTSGLGSACTTPSRRSIWSRSSTPRPKPNLMANQQRSICDDFAEQAMLEGELERSCGYFTCSSAASTPSKSSTASSSTSACLRRTQDMEADMDTDGGSMASESCDMPAVSNLEWEMYMMTHAQCIMPKTSSPISLRRDATFEIDAPTLPSKSYHKWRNYLQSTPAHMLHNVTHIPEAIAGHFCPTDFPAFSDLDEMESAAKRYKVDPTEDLCTTSQLLAGYTHTMTTDL
ncbi:uncharacterized protein LOC115626874 [Scaptodrosophila lebanonensis]|uniref:Uncharacterized protein LOC115626874 n=1 Tax=Drosophila lebanonensis TaxID=7225 RepID=A0A6J2TRU9_DROLE|nr:uncharacterized protein LOC115626874 [Scaptodrosophila lebanonensis]